MVGGGGGRLFEAGRLLTFSAFRMGAYSRWALIRGWALIRINTVSLEILPFQSVFLLLFTFCRTVLNSNKRPGANYIFSHLKFGASWRAAII